MGVFDRFERRLERLVEGAFGRVFKGEAAPADIAHALTRETDDRKVVVGPGMVIAPNSFVVVLGDHDSERLGPYAEPLGEAFAEMLSAHAAEVGYSFAGPISVTLEHDSALETGRFVVRSDPAPSAGVVTGGRLSRPAGSAEPAAPGAAAAAPPAAAGPGVPPHAPPEQVPDLVPPPAPARHRIVVTGGGSADRPAAGDSPTQVSVPLTAPVTVIGRSASADVRLADPGVSRRHAELHLVGDAVRVLDAGSTNGTRVNGEPVTARHLQSGDQIQVGTTVLVYRRAD